MTKTIEPLTWVAVCALVLAVLSLYLIFGRSDGMQVNAGFLLLGLVAGTFVSIAVEMAKRPLQRRDLARALHVELAEFVARCCFDFESPWRKYLAPDLKAKDIDQFRLNKFVPARPIIFEAAASDIALLTGTAPQALIQFYYQVSAWRRDASNFVASLQAIEQKDSGPFASPPTLDPAEARFLSQRLKQTLQPGLNALLALGKMVEDSEKVEDAAIASLDHVSRPGAEVSETSLRKRIAELVSPRSA